MWEHKRIFHGVLHGEMRGDTAPLAELRLKPREDTALEPPILRDQLTWGQLQAEDRLARNGV